MTQEKNTANSTAEQKEKNFIPMQIGVTDEIKKNKIISGYKKVLNAACDLQTIIEGSLGSVEELPVDIFFEALSEDIEIFIKRKFVEINNISIPGIKTEKLIESDLLDVDEVISLAAVSRKQFHEEWKNIKENGFVYPLRKLYTGKGYSWELTEDFYNEVNRYCSRWTKTEKQNEVLKKMNELCSVLNDLSAMGILIPGKGITEIETLKLLLNIDRGFEIPTWVVEDVLFYRGRARKYHERGFERPKYSTFEDFVS